MADWMNDMANAVEEAEAAQARAQEEVPTEPAISPRDSVLEVPVNDGLRMVGYYGMSPKTARDQSSLGGNKSSGLRPGIQDHPMGDELQLPSLEYRPEPIRDGFVLNEALYLKRNTRSWHEKLHKHSTMICKGSGHKMLNMKHTNRVSENGMPKSKLKDWMLQHFQAVHHLKAFHRSVYFHESMRPFDRMIQVSLLIHSQL